MNCVIFIKVDMINKNRIIVLLDNNKVDNIQITRNNHIS